MQEKPAIPNPDIKATLNSSLLNSILSKFKSKQIPLDKGHQSNWSYFDFDKASLSTDATRRVLILSIEHGRLKFKFVTCNTIIINGATMEFVPKIRKTDKKLYLDLHARIVNSNIDDIPSMVERGILHGLNDYLTKKDEGNGFMSFDLSDKITPSIKLPISGYQTDTI